MTGAIAVHHVVEGPAGAPALVLSNSLGTTRAMWDPQAARLARHFRLIRYDLRGHGQSPVPPGPYDIADLGADLIALLDRLGIARAHSCGLSLGGMVSLWVASSAPERVDRQVVCCTSALLGPPSMWSGRAAAVLAHGTGSIADSVVERWFTPEFRSTNAVRVQPLRDMLVASSDAGYAACCGALERMNLEPDLGGVRAPTLAVAAADDRATPPDHLFRIAAAITGCRVAVVPRAAHLANVEQPETVTDLILAHLLDGGPGNARSEEEP